MLDYSKYKYEQEQKQKQARKHQQQVNIREIKLRPKIATNDYNTKKGHVERFLKHGDKVKVTIMFRGREQAHPERGRDALGKLFEDLGGLGVIESAPLQEGRNMSMLLAPSKEARAESARTPRRCRRDDAEADSTSARGVAPEGERATARAHRRRPRRGTRWAPRLRRIRRRSRRAHDLLRQPHRREDLDGRLRRARPPGGPVGRCPPAAAGPSRCPRAGTGGSGDGPAATSAATAKATARPATATAASSARGWGDIPATLAEYNLDSFAGLDFYDVSMVDGSNLPMYIRVIHGEADRSVDANGCLAPVGAPRKSTARRRCASPAAAPIRSAASRPAPASAATAIAAAARSPRTARPARTWPIDYSKVFKRAEPFAYSWSGDDATSVFTCKGGCDYEIVFGVTPPRSPTRRDSPRSA